MALNLMPLVIKLQETLAGLTVWPIGSVGTTVQPRPAHQVLAIEDAPMLAPVVPIGRGTGSSASSSSSAIVPVAVVPEAPGHNTAEAFALGQLHELGAGTSRIHFDALRHVAADTVLELQRKQLVSVDHTEFGELTIALRAAAHTIVPVYGVCAPVPAYRAASSLPPLKRSKLSILVRLHEEGWRPLAGVAAYDVASEKTYRPGLAQPLSYFVALLESEAILAKVPQIIHGGHNHYYLCLLRLSAAQLAALLDRLGENDTFFSKGDEATDAEKG